MEEWIPLQGNGCKNSLHVWTEHAIEAAFMWMLQRGGLITRLSKEDWSCLKVVGAWEGHWRYLEDAGQEGEAGRWRITAVLVLFAAVSFFLSFSLLSWNFMLIRVLFFLASVLCLAVVCADSDYGLCWRVWCMLSCCCPCWFWFCSTLSLIFIIVFVRADSDPYVCWRWFSCMLILVFIYADSP